MVFFLFQENYRRLIELTRNAQSAYMEMVTMLEKDQNSATGGTSGVVLNSSSSSSSSMTAPTASQNFPLFTHMGHSRTPSACSAISFTSSILSEPISENYPHSEPETDSRGYEIVRDHNAMLAVKVAAAAASTATENPATGGEQQQADDEEPRSQDEQAMSEESTNSSSAGKLVLDYEADTEEDHSCVKQKTPRGKQQAEVSLNGFHEDIEEFSGKDGGTEVAHIDSIHSSVMDLSTEILSQISSKTMDREDMFFTAHIVFRL